MCAMITAKATPAQAENGQKYDVPPRGQAAQKGVWPWDSPAFQPLERFLLVL
jgi:hypothetical protein